MVRSRAGAATMTDPSGVLRPHVSLATPRGWSSALPPELLEAVRGRVRLLALLLLTAFAFDPITFLATWAVSVAGGYTLPDAFPRTAAFPQSARDLARELSALGLPEEWTEATERWLRPEITRW
jgi:hypothetical protein